MFDWISKPGYVWTVYDNLCCVIEVLLLFFILGMIISLFDRRK